MVIRHGLRPNRYGDGLYRGILQGLEQYIQE